MILSIMAIVAVAIGVGVGVGVGTRHGNAESVTSTSSSTIAQSTATTSTTVAGALPTLLKHGVVNDSSLAAVITSDGVRHVFFQDTNGTIRQATRAVSSSSIWGSPLNVAVASDARRYTPMSAIVRTYGSIGALFADEVGT